MAILGPMSAVYATALSIGTAISASLTVPIADAAGSWRVGLGVWAIFPSLANLPWLSTIRRESRPVPKASAELRRLDHRDLIRSQTVWMLTLFFGALSAIAYIGFRWMAHFMSAHNVPAATVGAMVVLRVGVSIPGAMLIPTITLARHRLIVESGSASRGA